MKWLKIGAVLFVVVFLVLYLGANFVDSRSSVLPHALIARLSEVGFALYGYSQVHGRFPDRLEDLVDSPIYLGEAVDPYAPDRSLFGYRRVVDATGEHYELYTVRMTAPAQIGWLTAEQDLWTKTAAFETLHRNELVPESSNEKLRPGADLSERLLFLFQKGR